MTRGTLYGGLFLGSAAALVIAVAAAENAPAQNFERNPQTQIPAHRLPERLQSPPLSLAQTTTTASQNTPDIQTSD